MPGSSVPVEALLRRSIYILTVSACFAGLTLVELAVLVVALESRDRLLPSDVPALRKLSLPELRASDAVRRKLPPPSPAEVRPSNAEGATGGPIILSLSPHVARSFTTRTSDRCRRLVVNLI